MTQLVKFDNPAYTIAATRFSVGIRLNGLGNVMTLGVNDVVRLIGELEQTLDILREEKGERHG